MLMRKNGNKGANSIFYSGLSNVNLQGRKGESAARPLKKKKKKKKTERKGRKIKDPNRNREGEEKRKERGRDSKKTRRWRNSTPVNGLKANGRNERKIRNTRRPGIR